MLKIDIHADCSSYDVFKRVGGEGDIRPLLRPSQIFGIIRNAMYGDRNGEVTQSQIEQTELRPRLEEYREALGLFRRLRAWSVTYSVGLPYQDYCAPMPKMDGEPNRKWDGSPLKELSGKDLKKPLTPFNKTYWPNFHGAIFLDGSPDDLKRIQESLKKPLGSLYVGKKCCFISELRVREVEKFDKKDFRCKHIGAASAEFRELQKAGLNGEPNYYRLPIRPSNLPGQYEFDDWCEMDMSGFSPNPRLVRPTRDFIYVIDRESKGGGWAHAIVHKYFGKGIPWYISGQTIVVYCRDLIRKFGNLKVTRCELAKSGRLIQCVIDYIPKDYTLKQRQKMPGGTSGRQNMSPKRTRRLRESLQVSQMQLLLLSRRTVKVKGVDLFCWRFGFEKKAKDLIPLLFKRHGGKFGSYGYGAIQFDVDELI